MKYSVCVLVVMLIAGVALADTLTLNSAETLTPESSQKLSWEIVRINAQEKVLTVKYQWLDASDTPVYTRPGGVLYWDCRDDGSSTCFSDVFGFVIRSGDVGTKIGAGLRTLIWNKMKADVLKVANNTGTFSE